MPRRRSPTYVVLCITSHRSDLLSISNIRQGWCTRRQRRPRHCRRRARAVHPPATPPPVETPATPASVVVVIASATPIANMLLAPRRPPIGRRLAATPDAARRPGDVASPPVPSARATVDACGGLRQSPAQRRHHCRSGQGRSSSPSAAPPHRPRRLSPPPSRDRRRRIELARRATAAAARASRPLRRRRQHDGSSRHRRRSRWRRGSEADRLRPGLEVVSTVIDVASATAPTGCSHAFSAGCACRSIPSARRRGPQPQSIPAGQIADGSVAPDSVAIAGARR